MDALETVQEIMTAVRCQKRHPVTHAAGADLICIGGQQLELAPGHAHGLRADRWNPDRAVHVRTVIRTLQHRTQVAAGDRHGELEPRVARLAELSRILIIELRVWRERTTHG